MKVPGFFHAAVRTAAVPAAFVCLACVSEAAVPEAAAPQSGPGEYHAVVDRLGRLERELNELQRATYSRLAARRTGPQTATDGGYAGPSDISQQRLNDLEAALRALTGRVEQLEYQIRGLNERMQRLNASVGPAGTGPQASAQPGGGIPGTDTPSGLGQPRNLAATMPPPSGSRPEEGSGMPGAQPGTPDSSRPDASALQPPSPPPEPGTGESGGQSGTPSNIPKLSGDEGRDFNTARDLLLRGEFARAGDMFGAITKAYPKSELAGDSQFWKAESLFVRELYRDAAEAYLAVARDFPDSSRAPDSLVKLAMSFDKLGERKQACAALSQLDRRYPNAPERVRQNAERYKEEFTCA